MAAHACFTDNCICKSSGVHPMSSCISRCVLRWCARVPCPALCACRKPRPTNLDYFTKALLHRDLEVYAERKAQQA
jgi:hypothetical protein